MKVSSKIATASALLIVLLLAVLIYDLTVLRRLATVNQELSEIDLRATTISLEQARYLNRLEEFVQKLFVVRDADYAAELVEVRTSFEKSLEHIQALALSSQQQVEVTRLVALWQELPWQVLSEIPDSTQPTPDESGLEHTFLLQLDLLKGQTEAIRQTTQEEISLQVARSARASQQAKTLSGMVVLAALVLSLPIVLASLLSMREPLRRLREGTASVAEGQFDVQLDTSGDDEFAGVASSFNEMVARLGELDRLKNEFLSHVSHELKTPLVAMDETHRLLLEELPGPLNEKQKRLLELNLTGSRRLSTMISKLLDVARMEQGAASYELKPHDLRPLVAETLEALRPAADEAGIVLVGRQPEEPVVAVCDRQRIHQVISNLIENAIKFSPTSSKVEISVGSSSALAIIEVTDSGLGVPDEQKAKIFEKFHQLGPPGTSSRGVGLGLTICREIAQAHRGHVSVRDNRGAGSIFRLTLPTPPAGLKAAS